MIDFQLLFNVGGADAGQDIEIHMMFFEQSNAAQDTIEGGRAALVPAIEIMRFARTVEADPDQKAIFGEEFAPLIVQQGAIGLQGVINVHTGTRIFFLISHRAAEEIHAHQGWLAALPGKVDFRHSLGCDVLAGIIFQCFV